MAKSLKPFVIDKVYPQAIACLQFAVGECPKPSCFEENDGSSVWLKYSGNDRIVQVRSIIDQRDEGDGLHYEISDGIVSWTAIVSKGCTVIDRDNHARSLDEILQGSLIVLSQYKLRLRYCSKDPKEFFNFYVLKFKIRGNEGGPLFSNPSPIETFTGFEALTQYLAQCKRATRLQASQKKSRVSLQPTSPIAKSLETSRSISGDPKHHVRRKRERPRIESSSGDEDTSDQKNKLRHLIENTTSTQLQNLGDMIHKVALEKRAAVKEKLVDEIAGAEPARGQAIVIDLEESSDERTRQTSPQSTTRSSSFYPDDVWEKLEIKRKDIHIPADQRKLLAEGCRHWLPQPVGRHSSMTRVIPEKVLNEFTRSVDNENPLERNERADSDEEITAERPTKNDTAISKSVVREPESRNAELDSQADREVFATTQEWPPSPFQPNHKSIGTLPNRSTPKSSCASSRSSSLTSSPYGVRGFKRLPPDSDEEDLPRQVRKKAKPVRHESIFDIPVSDASEEAMDSNTNKLRNQQKSPRLLSNKSSVTDQNPVTMTEPIPRPIAIEQHSKPGGLSPGGIEAAPIALSSERQSHKDPQPVQVDKQLHKIEAPSAENPPPRPAMSIDSDSDSEIEFAAPMAFDGHRSESSVKVTPVKSSEGIRIQIEKTPLLSDSPIATRTPTTSSGVAIPASYENSSIHVTSSAQDAQAIFSDTPKSSQCLQASQDMVVSKPASETTSHDVLEAQDENAGVEPRPAIRFDPSFLDDTSSQIVPDPALSARNMKKEYFAELRQQRTIGNKALSRGSDAQSNKDTAVQTAQETCQAQNLTKEAAAATPFLEHNDQHGNAREKDGMRDSPVSNTARSEASCNPTKTTSVSAVPRKITVTASASNKDTVDESASNTGSNAPQVTETNIQDQRPQSSENERLYFLFKETYKVYNGSMSHFTSMVNTLRSKNEVPPMYWDNFVVVHDSQYKQYVGQCLNTGKDALGYFQYWETLPHPTKHDRQVLSQESTALVDLDHSDVGKNIFATRSDPALTEQSRDTKDIELRDKAVGTSESFEPYSTGDNQDRLRSESPHKPTPRRSLPWTLGQDSREHFMLPATEPTRVSEPVLRPPSVPLHVSKRVLTEASSNPLERSKRLSPRRSMPSLLPSKSTIPRVKDVHGTTSSGTVEHQSPFESPPLSEPARPAKLARAASPAPGWFNEKKLRKSITIFSSFAKKKK